MGDGSVPTVRIVDEDVAGGRLINEADFDAQVHKKFEEPKAEEPKGEGAKGGKKAKE